MGEWQGYKKAYGSRNIFVVIFGKYNLLERDNVMEYLIILLAALLSPSGPSSSLLPPPAPHITLELQIFCTPSCKIVWFFS